MTIYKSCDVKLQTKSHLHSQSVTAGVCWRKNNYIQHLCFSSQGLPSSAKFCQGPFFPPDCEASRATLPGSRKHVEMKAAILIIGKIQLDIFGKEGRLCRGTHADHFPWSISAKQRAGTIVGARRGSRKESAREKSTVKIMAATA